MNLDQLRYPIGKFEQPELITKEIIEKWVLEISTFPSKLYAEVFH